VADTMIEALVSPHALVWLGYKEAHRLFAIIEASV